MKTKPNTDLKELQSPLSDNPDLEILCEQSKDPELTFYRILINHPHIKVWPNYAGKWFDKWSTIGYSDSIKNYEN